MRAVLPAALAAVAMAALVGLTACGSDAAKPADSTTSAQAPPSQAPSTSPTGSRLPTPISRPPEPKPPAGKPAGKTAPVSLGPSGEVVVEPGVTKVPASQVDASAVPKYYDHRGEVWVYDDGYSLAMFADASSGCTDAQAVVLDQSSTEVRIGLRPLAHPAGGRPDEGGACTAVMTPRAVALTLREPLGDRKIRLALTR
jgi:hypothetical protein